MLLVNLNLFFYQLWQSLYTRSQGLPLLFNFWCSHKLPGFSKKIVTPPWLTIWSGCYYKHVVIDGKNCINIIWFFFYSKKEFIKFPLVSCDLELYLFLKFLNQVYKHWLWNQSNAYPYFFVPIINYNVYDEFLFSKLHIIWHCIVWHDFSLT